MEIKKEKLPNSRVKLTVSISPIAMGEYFASALERLAASLTLPGFRPGKIPLSLVEQKIGQEKINQEVLEIALPLTYQEAIKKEKLIPLEGPKVNIKEFGKGQALIFEAEVDILPEVKLGDYRRLEIQNPTPEIRIKDQEIEAVLKQLQRQTANLKPKEGRAKKGDWLLIDFESFLGDKPVDKGSSKNHPLVLGQGQFVPEFEEKLEGMEKGKEKKFSLKFPSKFHNKELQGKEISFKVKLNELKEIELPEISDHWAQKLGQKNLKNLKESIKKSLEREGERKKEEEFKQKIIKKITEESSCELPESLVNQELRRIVQNVALQVQSQGLSFEQYLKNIKKTEEDLIKDLRPQAEKNVKTSLILEEIRKAEKIEVSEKELSEEVEKIETEQKKRDQNFKLTEEEKGRIRKILGIKKTVEKLVERVKR